MAGPSCWRTPDGTCFMPARTKRNGLPMSEFNIEFGVKKQRPKGQFSASRPGGCAIFARMSGRLKSEYYTYADRLLTRCPSASRMDSLGQ